MNLEIYKKLRDAEYYHLIKLLKLRTPPKPAWLSWLMRSEPDNSDALWAAYQRWRWYNDKVTEYEELNSAENH